MNGSMIHRLMKKRIAKLMLNGWEEDEEFKALVSACEAYEKVCFPHLLPDHK